MSTEQPKSCPVCFRRGDCVCLDENGDARGTVQEIRDYSAALTEAHRQAWAQKENSKK